MSDRKALETHLDDVARAITTGRLVAFLGAGANLCARPENLVWQAGQTEHLPLGGELAEHLAAKFKYPYGGSKDLARVSQWVALEKGSGDLYVELHSLFDADYPVTDLHRFFASLPAILRDKGYLRDRDPTFRRLLFVTTNYDDLLERAFAEQREPFHLVFYQAESERQEGKGKFFHRPPGSEPRWVDRPNEYKGLVGDEHPVVLKIHGAVDRAGDDQDSFVITEDHYIEYLDLAPTVLSALIPVPLPALLRNSHLLFLGYGLKDWNLRVILHRLWRERKLSWKHWAIQRYTDPLDCQFWSHSGVEIHDLHLAQYIAALQRRVQELPAIEVAKVYP